ATLRLRPTGREALFWGVVGLGIISSTTLFYFADGVRTYSVIYPLVVLFISLAAFSPSSIAVFQQAKTVRQFRAGRWSVAAGAVPLFLIPFVGRFLYRIERVRTPTGMNAIVGGVAKSSGLLVVADDQPLPYGIPSAHFSDFADWVHSTGVEQDQGLITPMAPR